MMRILMLSARYLPFAGGTETHVSEVAIRLVRKGHAVTVLTGNPDGLLPAAETRDGVQIVRLKTYPRGRDWCFAPGVFKAVAEGDWDLMHVQGYHTFLAPLGMAAASRKGLPFVVTFHSGGHSSRFRSSIRRFQHRMLAPLAARAAQLIGVSRFEADLFSRNMAIARDRFIVIPNGARLPEKSGRRPASPHDRRLIVSLGRLERYKGHHRALAAFHVLATEFPDMSLRILGEGPYEAKLRQQVAELGLGNRVEIGAIPPTDRSAMADLLSSAALVVLLSDYEAHPVAVMEALSVKAPVLTTDTSGFRELAEEGLVRSIPLNASPDVTAREMLAAINAGPISIETKLPDWDDCTDRLLKVYGRVLSHPQPELRTGPALLGDLRHDDRC
ncbi:glycosyltransferase family 4 protein [Rhizobium leguminosarum]|uniref:glycosyltransferase family 4 protein n=1 Tax=Rhizobium leguminosarum TaxID=384 RepID=UPI001C96BB9C|nr:glycosyltransferase family 4 protein [Rhizobium leguminosarum]MBY5820913.1 glycosyltransferase family 4 protein [Rhizobium leguminosarum]